MWQVIFKALGGFNLFTAVVIWIAPLRFYETVPGVALTGAFNAHFLRDVALAYLVSGAAIWIAVRRHDVMLGLFAVAWPFCHAVFHLWMWAAHRGAALDRVAAAECLGVILPAGLAVIAVWQLHQRGVLS